MNFFFFFFASLITSCSLDSTLAFFSPKSLVWSPTPVASFSKVLNHKGILCSLFVISSVYLCASPTSPQFSNTSIWHSSRYEGASMKGFPHCDWSLKAHQITFENLQWDNDGSAGNSFFSSLWDLLKYILSKVIITYIDLTSWAHMASSLIDDSDEEIAPHNKKRKL